MILNNTYKSIDYSKKETNKSWGILSFYILKKNNFSKSESLFNIYLSRTILYIENDNTISQIGKMYVPFFSIKYLCFFCKLIFSRKTLGHYIKDSYSNSENNVTFKVVKEYQSNTTNSIILNKNEYKVTERIIEIKSPKLTIYVKEIK